MSLRPGYWLGLPPLGVWGDVAVLRVVLMILALGAGLLVARSAHRVAGGLALAIGATALCFWIASFGRPYGLGVDAASTLALCELAVARELGAAGSGCVLGVPAATALHESVGAASGRLELPLELALALPSFLPVAGFLLVGALLQLRSWRRTGARLVAFTWLAVSATQLDLAAPPGGSFLLWGRPATFVALVPALALYLATFRRRSGGLLRATVASALLGGAAAALLGGETNPVTAGELLRVLWWGPGLWAILGWTGALRDPDRTGLGLLAGSLALLTLALAGAPLSLHFLRHWHRLGLVLGVASLLGRLCDEAGDLAEKVPSLTRRRLEGLLVAALLSGNALVWWSPPRLDPVASSSLEEESQRLVEIAGWIRAHTPRDAVFLASPGYASSVGALAGRRVFRAPTLKLPEDDGRRRAIEGRLLGEGLERDAARRLGLTHVFTGPGDAAGFSRWLPRDPPRAARLIHSSYQGFHVYEVETTRPEPAGSAGAAEAQAHPVDEGAGHGDREEPEPDPREHDGAQ